MSQYNHNFEYFFKKENNEVLQRLYPYGPHRPGTPEAKRRPGRLWRAHIQPRVLQRDGPRFYLLRSAYDNSTPQPMSLLLPDLALSITDTLI